MLLIGLYDGMKLEGRTHSVKSGETQTIPIPRREADIAALKAEIDEIVYDLFGLEEEEEREVVEGYLEVF